MRMKADTRQRILIASLELFNQHGESHTSLNEIADEVDISPGNLHYHFRRKAMLVEALVDEFQVDAKGILRPPAADEVSVDNFWYFLHSLVECTATYRFLFRDLEALTQQYPKVGRVMGHFARGVLASFRLWLHELDRRGWLQLSDDDVQVVGRNLAVIALFSERFDVLVDKARSADESALRVARAMLDTLRPYTVDETAGHFATLAAHYES
jgi:AcrR family transcriptional regulator